jgi:hypothetical protein
MQAAVAQVFPLGRSLALHALMMEREPLGERRGRLRVAGLPEVYIE